MNGHQKDYLAERRDSDLLRAILCSDFGTLADSPGYNEENIDFSDRKEAPMALIRVVLADDHAVVRKGIRDFLEEENDIQVLAEAADGAQVKAMILEHKPDVAILDIRMPAATGIEVTRWIREQKLSVGVLILTAYEDDPFIVAAVQAGADGYVLKNAEAEQITAAVRTIYEGESALSPAITRRLMAQLGSPPNDDLAEPLTDREREVLQLAASGLTNRGIGRKLSISDRTVQGHLASIYAKLHVGSRTEAVTKALQLKMITLD